MIKDKIVEMRIRTTNFVENLRLILSITYQLQNFRREFNSRPVYKLKVHVCQPQSV